MLPLKQEPTAGQHVSHALLQCHTSQVRPRHVRRYHVEETDHRPARCLWARLFLCHGANVSTDAHSPPRAGCWSLPLGSQVQLISQLAAPAVILPGPVVWGWREMGRI